MESSLLTSLGTGIAVTAFVWVAWTLLFKSRLPWLSWFTPSRDKSPAAAAAASLAELRREVEATGSLTALERMERQHRGTAAGEAIAARRRQLAAAQTAVILSEDEARAIQAETARKAAAALALSPVSIEVKVVEKNGKRDYVVVLGATSSKKEALGWFGELQHKHVVLRGKSASVQLTVLDQTRSIYHLLVGPPAVKEVAVGLCRQLLMSGHKGCWVLAV